MLQSQEECQDNYDYKMIKQIVKNFHIVNDLAEKKVEFNSNYISKSS